MRESVILINVTHCASAHTIHIFSHYLHIIYYKHFPDSGKEQFYNYFVPNIPIYTEFKIDIIICDRPPKFPASKGIYSQLNCAITNVTCILSSAARELILKFNKVRCLDALTQPLAVLQNPLSAPL